MPEPLWKQIDAVERRPVLLETDDRCYYARDYVAKGGFSASEANQLISNFKKGMERRGKPDWRYKGLAIERFARELATAFSSQHVVAHIPTSKAKEDPDYDDRFEQTLKLLARLRPGIRIERPFERVTSCDAVHLGGTRRIDVVKESLRWLGFGSPPPTGIFLIDDVVTMGTHFKACQSLILDHHPTCAVGGVFWGRTIWLESSADF